MIISKFQFKDLLITLGTGKLVNSNVIYFYVETIWDNQEIGIISTRTFIYDEALEQYLSSIKIAIESRYTKDYRPKTEEDLISPA